MPTPDIHIDIPLGGTAPLLLPLSGFTYKIYQSFLHPSDSQAKKLKKYFLRPKASKLKSFVLFNTSWFYAVGRFT
jgi:hypothetical protein